MAARLLVIFPVYGKCHVCTTQIAAVAAMAITTKTSDRDERKWLKDLTEALDQADASLWTAGRLINDLKEKYDWITQELADQLPTKFPQSRNRLNEIRLTWAAFPEEKSRDARLSFFAHENVRKSAKNLARGASRVMEQRIEPDYQTALKVAAAHRHVRGRANVRETTRVLAAEFRKRIEPQRLASVAGLSEQNKMLVSTMHHGNCLDVMADVVPGTIKLVHLDPPYANYAWRSDGGLEHLSSSVPDKLDNNNRADAMAATIGAIQAAVPLLVHNGMICLWQAANGLPWETARAIEDAGLTLWPTLVWDKGHAQMGDAASGLTYSTEFCYVLTRKGEHVSRLDVGNKGQLIREPRVGARAENIHETHIMMKPAAVNRELLERFTNEGDIVLDAFGCTGSMAIAAQQTGRRWIYAESNRENFERGRRLMQDALRQLQKSA